ncbi:hypothetical protein SAMN04488003_12930 [Loktanella fryxellensis]|uniref:Uncharacterized protein n=1 Tax=Loktanella fryxellensis TaxID=245187 RepID=A0A1H8IXA7_9RHOB|nr:hypothetical protein [Loktanella fryxellensis]SEN72795.1 hypothetical protein SAMN04488003_12930 [Loktanella fryxellensis]
MKTILNTFDAGHREWRCTCCNKLLGLRSGSVVLVQFARGHQYRAPRPVSAVCRSCKTLNET